MTSTPEVNVLAGARLRLFAVASIVVSVVWAIAPGKIQPDTKFDLVEDPWGYLWRALFAWNDHAGLGELQNQAYGYLFPMGPFFGVFHSLGFPEWAIQRFWWSFLILVGFFGAHRVAVKLGGFTSDWAIVVALLYVFSPRLLSVLSEISIEAWPASLAPWLVLAAAAMVSKRASWAHQIRGAATTILLVSALGGVNATASLAVLILPLIWILTAPRNSRAFRVVIIWLTAAILGALWWLLPLFILGGFGYPFLDYIETSKITTAVTSLPNALRGTDHWIAFILDGAGHPVWQSGWVQAQYILAIVSGLVVAGFGVYGLMILRTRRDLSHAARFLYLSLLVGLVLVSVGYSGTPGSPVSSVVREFLDGVGAPFRNVHKFDPLIRLPIAFGFVYGVRHLLEHRRKVAHAIGVAGLVFALLSPTALWVGRIGDANAFVAVPESWVTTAELIDEMASVNGGSTLVLPHARNAEMTWGKVSDEPLVALAKSPVVLRAAAPLGHPGAVRLLDAIDLVAGEGLGSPALAPALNRMGIARVVVRSDVSSSIRMHDPAKVEQSLMNSPGFTLVERVSDEISIWSVQSTSLSGATLYKHDQLLNVDGSPEALLWGLQAGVIDSSRPTATAPGVAPAELRTDTFRWTTWNSGLLPAWATSELLAASNTAPTAIGARPLPPLADPDDHVVRVWQGDSQIRASSSGSDPFGDLSLGSGYSTAAALDDDLATAWWSDAEKSSWYEIDFSKPVDLGRLNVALAAPSRYRAPDSVNLRVWGANERDQNRSVAVDSRGDVSLDLSGTKVSQVRISFPNSPVDRVVGIAEVSSSKIDLGSKAKLPNLIDFAAESLALFAERTGNGHVLVGQSLIGRRAEGTHQQEWLLNVAEAKQLAADVSVRAHPGPELDRVLDGFVMSTEHRRSSAPNDRPGASFDADPTTTWTVPAGVDEAIVDVKLDKKTLIEGLSLSDESRGVRFIHRGGVVRMAPGSRSVGVTTDSFSLAFKRPNTVDDESPWRIPETQIIGLTPQSDVFETECGAVRVELGESAASFRLSTTREELSNIGVLRVERCTSKYLTVPDGMTSARISLPTWLAWNALAIHSSERTPEGLDPVATQDSPEKVALRRINPTRLSVEVDTLTQSILVLPQGFNRGWIARDSHGNELEAIEIDGWQQGFIVPAHSAETLSITFDSQKLHALGLMSGPAIALAALFVFVIASRRVRRLGSAEVDANRDIAPLVQEEVNPSRALGHGLIGQMLAVGAVGALFGGPIGGIFALGVLALPIRWLLLVAPGALCAAGVLMSALGVVDHASAGAIAGQTLSLVSLAALVRWWFVHEQTSVSAFPRRTTRNSQ